MKFLILMIVMALTITANAECEVNGYYKANGTWVDGYTKSGDCWNGKIIGYDAQGRTADERRAIDVENNRLIIPFVLLLIILLATWGVKVEEDSALHTTIFMIIAIAILYIIIRGFYDPIIFLLIVPGGFFWNLMMKRKEKEDEKRRNKANKKYQQKLEKNRETYSKAITYCNKHLNERLSLEFVVATRNMTTNEDIRVDISRELSIALYSIKEKEQLFNNKVYTVFTIMNLGVIIKKVNGTAVNCYLVPKKVALAQFNSLDDYFTESDDLFG